jgi:hypothetical protein
LEMGAILFLFLLRVQTFYERYNIVIDMLFSI